jgi:hypothetical protein
MSSLATLPLAGANISRREDYIGRYEQLVRLRNAVQSAPLQQQALQQENQARALGIQQQQLQIQDQQALTSAMKEWDGQNFMELPSLVLKHGGSGQAVLGLKSSILKQQQDFLGLTKAQQDIEQTKADHFAQVLQNVHDLPADQQPDAFAKGVQDSVAKGWLDPQQAQGLQYQSPEQVDMLRKMAIGHKAAQEELLKQAQTGEAQAKGAQAGAEAQKTGMETQFMQTTGGLTGPMADALYRAIQVKKNLGQPLSAQEQAQAAAYEKQKLLVPTTTAAIRVEGMGQLREYPVLNTQTGQLEYRSANDINAANKLKAGTYAPAGEGTKAMSKTALIEDIRGNLQQVRDSLNNPKMPEFTADQRAEIAIALGGREPSGALQAAFRGGVLGSLSPEQQEYLVNMAQLTENAMAMRSVLGAGQGSEDMRSAIKATLPGPRTPTKVYALNQLQKFEAVLNRLERGIPNVPLRNPGGQGASNSGWGAQFGGSLHQ